MDFQQQNVDLCIMIGNSSSAGLSYDYLFTSEMFPVASPTLANTIARPEDLARQTILQVHPSREDWQTWLQHNDCRGVDPDSGLQFDNYDHALSTAAKGMGVAIGMRPYIEQDLRSGALVELFPGQRVAAPRQWYLVCRKERSDAAKVQLFRKWLLEELAKEGPWPDFTRTGNLSSGKATGTP